MVAVLEAMKMEHELTAPAAGTLDELRVAEGDQVESGAVIGVIGSGEERGEPARRHELAPPGPLQVWPGDGLLTKCERMLRCA